ncbi:hypothetical protein AVEN_225413-1 [Araneus ventricosus]|uniref:Uncharacterized protein n=1 Tax=Araneus ventricosus TaxID=182803 RepID=A0A4Y2W7N2_ARAVE|nr:hypothetical protein AVEN_225413-1 [Araneus ventricosus]
MTTGTRLFRHSVPLESISFGLDFRAVHMGRQACCSQITVNEWIKTPAPPSLTAYEDINGTVRFSLKQLFALDKRYLKGQKQSATFRGIPANKWMYEIRGKDDKTNKATILNIYAFWSGELNAAMS